MIRSLIIDDEPDAREALKLTIGKFCPQVEMLECCPSPDEGLHAIRNLQPDLVFLDVQMPHMSGFDLLEEIGEIHFAVIFVTAHDRYAIKAIKFSALDYLLKPIDTDELVGAVQKMEARQHQQDHVYRYGSVLSNIRNQPGDIKKLAIPTSEGILFVQTANIIYCRADGNYSTLFLKNGESILVSKPLIDFELMLAESGFFRVHHASLVNMNHIQKYIKGDGGYVVLTENHNVDVSRRKREAFLNQLHKI